MAHLHAVFDRLLREEHQFIFKVDGKLLAMFEYKPDVSLENGHPVGSFYCYGTPAIDRQRKPFEYCMKIRVQADAIFLSDYYYNFSQHDFLCPMKPSPGDTAHHKKYLNTLLDFLAFALRKKTISLIDASSKKFDICPKIPVYVFLVAGKPSFYETVAGFKNDALTARAKQVSGNLLTPAEVKQVKTKLNVKLSTYGQLANELIRICKGPQTYVTEENIESLIDIINTELDPTDMLSYHHEKKATGEFQALVTTSATLKGPFKLLITKPQQYVMVDILSNSQPTVPGIPTRRKPKNPANCKWGVDESGYCKRKPKNVTLAKAVKVCKYGRTKSNNCRRTPCKYGMDAAENCKRR